MASASGTSPSTITREVKANRTVIELAEGAGRWPVRAAPGLKPSRDCPTRVLLPADEVQQHQRHGDVPSCRALSDRGRQGPRSLRRTRGKASPRGPRTRPVRARCLNAGASPPDRPAPSRDAKVRMPEVNLALAREPIREKEALRLALAALARDLGLHASHEDLHRLVEPLGATPRRRVDRRPSSRCGAACAALSGPRGDSARRCQRAGPPSVTSGRAPSSGVSARNRPLAEISSPSVRCRRSRQLCRRPPRPSRPFS